MSYALQSPFQQCETVTTTARMAMPDVNIQCMRFPIRDEIYHALLT